MPASPPHTLQLPRADVWRKRRKKITEEIIMFVLHWSSFLHINTRKKKNEIKNHYHHQMKFIVIIKDEK
jgi:hypothetical protein